MLFGDYIAMVTGPAAAAAFARRGLDHLRPDDPRRPAALVSLARGLRTTNDFAAAAAALDEADALLRARGDDLVAARLASIHSSALRNAGESSRAIAVLAAARSALQGEPTADLAAIIAEQAMMLLVVGDDAAALALADEAVTVARERGVPTPCRALIARGAARWAAEPEEGEEDLVAAIEAAVRVGDLYSARNAYGIRAVWRSLTSIPAGLAAADEAMAFCAARGLPAEEIELNRCVDMILRAGRWDEAAEIARRLADWAVAHGNTATEASARCVLAAVSIGRGEVSGPLDDLARLGRSVGLQPSFYGLYVAQGALARDDREAALESLQDTLDASPANSMDYLADLVRVALRAGSPALARRALEVGVSPCPRGDADTLTAKAELARFEGRIGEARASLQEAVETWRGMGEVVAEADALASLGRCLLTLGETDEAVARLREARDLCLPMMAAPRIANIDELLGATVEPPPVRQFL
jgi:tetratricopeptide (TPR) repeat protein